jgi:hypothetical protein
MADLPHAAGIRELTVPSAVSPRVEDPGFGFIKGFTYTASREDIHLKK